MKRALSIAFGLVLAALCLWLFFRGVDPRELWLNVLHANPVLLAVLVVSAILHLVLRAARWRTLLGPAARDVRFTELLSAVSIGYMALILPGRVSEVLRPTALTRRTGIPFGATLGTVAAERLVLDTPMLVLFAALFLVLPASCTGLVATADPRLLAGVRSTGLVLLCVSAVALVFVAMLGRRREQVAARVAKWAEQRESRFTRRMCGWFNSVLPGLAAFGDAGGLARLALETLAIWVVIAAGIHCGVAACGVSLAPAATLIILPVTAIGIAVPTPGGAGTYHVAMKLVLVGLFGAETSAAVSASLLAHALPLASVIVLGAWFAIRGGLGRAPAAAVAAEARP